MKSRIRNTTVSRTSKVGLLVLFLGFVGLGVGHASPFSVVTTLTYLFNSNLSGGPSIVTPFGVARDTQGRLFIADGGAGQIRVFDQFNHYVTSFGSGLEFPYGVAVDTNNNIYVTDNDLHKVFVYDSSFTFIRQWGGNGSKTGKFKGPAGIAIGPGGKVYVADVGNYRIQVFGSTGKFLKQFGTPGAGNGQFAGPYGVVVDANGNVYIADTGNNRIQKFNKKYVWVKSWGSKGKKAGQFNVPRLLALDGAGRLFVADSKNNRIQIFDKNGIYLAKFGSIGSGAGQLSQPTGVVVSIDGNVVQVGDRLNGRVEVWYKEGYTPNYMFGDESDGDLVVPNGTTAYLDDARSGLASTASFGSTTLSVMTTQGFATGQEVLIHQSRGSGAGIYELNKIVSVGSGSLTLQTSLRTTYLQDGTSRSQVVRVPNYHDVTVQNGGTLTAHIWDGNDGGILVFRSNGTLAVQAGGLVSISGMGYRGGSGDLIDSQTTFQGESQLGIGSRSISQNGIGGGGVFVASGSGTLGGSGGGGYATAGGNGTNGNIGNSGNGGGTAGDVSLTTIIFGGGSGGGYNTTGSRGGGAAIIFARNITVTGSLVNNGIDGQVIGGDHVDGATGGGAGGSIFLKVGTAVLGSNLVLARPGIGQANPPSGSGGNGGDGRIRIEYCNSFSGSTNPAASVQQITCQ